MAQAGLQNRAELAKLIIFAVVVRAYAHVVYRSLDLVTTRALHLDIDSKTIFGVLVNSILISCLNKRMVFHNMIRVIY